MLIALLILAVISFITTIMLGSMANKRNFGQTYLILSLIQGMCLGALMGILAVLVLKGRTIG